MITRFQLPAVTSEQAMSSRSRFAIWLQPEPACAARLGRIIYELAQSRGGPLFAPHLTLLDEISASWETLAPAVADLAAELRAITVQPIGIHGENRRFRCLYMEFPRTDDLAHARVAAQARLDQEEGTFAPHMSLFYGRLADTDRDDLRLDLEARIPDVILLDRLALIDISAPVESWREISSIPLGI
ncbi:MAG: 2'-5' RNA ligase family protein [Acidiferrobacterales bacterium]